MTRPFPLLCLMTVLLACGGPVDNTAPADVVADQEEEDPLAPIADLPPFTLTDHTGAPYTRAALEGHVTVVNFIFTSCKDVCPVLSTHLAEVQGRYVGNDAVRLLSISVDPGTDTPEVLAAYAARFGVDAARWRFVTGPFDDVRAVVVDGFKNMLERMPGKTPDATTILHGERFVLVDRRARIRAFPDPKEPGKTTMFAWIDRLVAEGS
jgi:cytochrome oxidase Cu insertion factor (SCO1/SenC/PrrC family)